MLFTTALVLIVVWLLGIINSHASGGLIHVLLALAIVLFAVDTIRARRATTHAPDGGTAIPEDVA